MKEGLSIYFLLLAFATAFGQSQAEIKWGQVQQNGLFNKDFSYEILGTLNGLTYVMKTKGTSNPDYEIYDADLRLKKSISGKDNPYDKGNKMLGLYVLSDRLVRVDAVNNMDKDNSVSVTIVQLDPMTLDPKTEPIHAVRILVENNIQKYWAHEYVSVVSADKTKLLVYRNLRAVTYQGKADLPGDVHFVIYDNNLEKVTDKYWHLGEDVRYMLVADAAVSNSGEAAMVIELYKKGVSFATSSNAQFGNSTVDSYKFLYASSTGVSTETIILANDYLNQGKLVFFDNTSCAYSGFYSNRAIQNSVVGTYFYLYSPGKKFLTSKALTVFSTEYRNEFDSYTRSTQSKEVPRVYIRDLIDLVDGGAILVGEQILDGNLYVNGSQAYYWANDIIIIKFDANGNVVNEILIPKRQRVKASSLWAGTSFFSFSTLLKGDVLHLLINDDIGNIANKDNGNTAICSGIDDAIATHVVLDVNSGNYTKTALFKSSESNIVIFPTISKSISQNKLIVFGGNKVNSGVSDYRLGLVTFP